MFLVAMVDRGWRGFCRKHGESYPARGSFKTAGVFHARRGISNHSELDLLVWYKNS